MLARRRGPFGFLGGSNGARTWHKPHYVKLDFDPVTHDLCAGAIAPGVYCEDEATFEQILKDPMQRQIEAEKAFFSVRGLTWPVAAEGDAAVAAGGRLSDPYGNRFSEVGDLVTREGTDIHRVVSRNGSPGHAPDEFTVVCVKAPADGWTEVGEEEFNVCRRCEWVDDVIEGTAST